MKGCRKELDKSRKERTIKRSSCQKTESKPVNVRQEKEALLVAAKTGSRKGPINAGPK
jgi:hypothetical protein